VTSAASAGCHVLLRNGAELVTRADEVVEIVGPGHSFGEALMFMDKPYVLMAQALADTMLLHIAKNVVFAEIERDPNFARKMLAGLSLRLTT
jgi:CRP-like cAMP-binding protein